MNKLNGFLYGLLSSASFGLIPLFTIPAMREGMNFESILFYRFLFACLALGCILLLDKQSFHIKRKEIPSLMLLAFLYLMSAVFLFWGYKFMASGVATTIHFMYPVLTTLIMMIFFRERKSTWRFFAIALAVVGVSCLSYGDSSGGITALGLFIVLLSALGYALYLVTVSQLKIGQMKGLRLTFYVFLFGTLLLLAGIGTTTGIQTIPDWHNGWKPGTPGTDPDSGLQPGIGTGGKKHRLHAHFRTWSHGAGDSCLCRYLYIRRTLYPKHRDRYSADYFGSNRYYTETLGGMSKPYPALLCGK